MPPPIGGGIKRWCCLTSVWRLTSVCRGHRDRYIENRRIWHIGRPKLAQRYSPRHTWLGHHFKDQKVKGHGHHGGLLTTVLARQADAAVGVGTCWPWETADNIAVCSAAQGASAPNGEMGGGISWRPPAYSLF